MTIDYQSILGTPILHLNKKEMIGMLKDVIVHPDTGKIEAFWVKSVENPGQYSILLSQDILRWTNAVYIKDHSVIAEPDEVIRITEILGRECPIIGARVENKEGEYYGKAYGLLFNAETFYITQLQVGRNFLGVVIWARRFFPFNRIIKVLPHLIIVDDKSTEEERLTESPFIKDRAIDAI